MNSDENEYNFLEEENSENKLIYNTKGKSIPFDDDYNKLLRAYSNIDNEHSKNKKMIRAEDSIEILDKKEDNFIELHESDIKEDFNIKNEINEIQIPEKIQKSYGSYYDIDGLVMIIEHEFLYKNRKGLKYNTVSIQNPKLNPKKILNNNRINIKINNEYIKMKNYETVFLGNLESFYGRISLYIAFEKIRNVNNISIFFKLLAEYISKYNKYNSYFMKEYSVEEFLNVPLNTVTVVMKKMGEDMQNYPFLYGETFGGKVKFRKKIELKNILETEKVFFNYGLLDFMYFELDICKNIKISNRKKNKYITNFELKKGKKTGKNFFEKLIGKPLNIYNPSNLSTFNDYHINNINHSLSNKITISKINFYSPVTINILEELYNKSEIFSTKFAHEILYTAHNINLTTYYKYSNKYAFKNIKILKNRLTSIKNINNFYRLESRFCFSNFLETDYLMPVFSYFKKISRTNKYCKFRKYAYKNFIKNFYINTKFLGSIMKKTSTDYFCIAKKLFANIIFYEFFVRGGKKLHYLPEELKNKKAKITINKTLSSVYSEFEHELSNFTICVRIVEEYISKCNIKSKYKNMFMEIMKTLKYINSEKYTFNIICVFFEKMVKHYGMKSEEIYDNKCHPNNYIVKGDTNSENFYIEYFQNVMNCKSNKINKLFYFDLVYAIKILKKKYDIKNINTNIFFNKYNTENFYVVDSIENNNLNLIKISKKILPSKNEFKKDLIEGICKKALSYKIFIDRINGKFFFTKQTKLLYKYFMINHKYDHEDFSYNGNLPFWLLFAIKTRKFSLKRVCEKKDFSDGELNAQKNWTENNENNILPFMLNNNFFHKKVDIINNSNFESLIKYIAKLERNEYVLCSTDYKTYSEKLNILHFEDNKLSSEAESIEANSVEGNGFIEITMENERFLLSLLYVYIMGLRHSHPKTNLFKLTETIKWFEYCLMPYSKNLGGDGLKQKLLQLLNYEEFKKYYTIEHRSDDVFYYFK